MNLLITIPSTQTPHGGLRVILEWANRLAKYHSVLLYDLSGKNNCSWFTVQVKYCDASSLWEADCVILTSPHSAHLLDIILPNQKCFLFLQMMEDMFKPTDHNWLTMCHKFYTSNYPVISISQWNIDTLRNKFGRIGQIHYIGNGVNLDHFPVSTQNKEPDCVLIEGWEPTNPTKDIDRISHKVALQLKKDGYTVIAYGGVQCRSDFNLLHQYFRQPSLSQLNRIYERASVLIKASKYDARSCSPVEAMTKGTVTARAIIQGDDDLVHEENCLRCDYDADQLYIAAKRILTDNQLRSRLSESCVKYAESLNWDGIIDHVNSIICNG